MADEMSDEDVRKHNEFSAESLLKSLCLAVRGGTTLAWCLVHDAAAERFAFAWKTSADDWCMRDLVWLVYGPDVRDATCDPLCFMEPCHRCCAAIRRLYPLTFDAVIGAKRNG